MNTSNLEPVGFMIDPLYAEREFNDLEQLKLRIGLLKVLYQNPQPISQEMLNEWWDMSNQLIEAVKQHQARLQTIVSSAMIPLYKDGDSEEVLITPSGDHIYNTAQPFK